MASIDVVDAETNLQNSRISMALCKSAVTPVR